MSWEYGPCTWLVKPIKKVGAMSDPSRMATESSSPLARIKRTRKRKANRRCFDCRARAPGFVCFDFATFVCVKCAGVHREFGHKVKALSMAHFSEADADAIESGGNAAASLTWLGRWEGKRLPSFRQEEGFGAIRKHLREKYIERSWYDDSAERTKTKGGSVMNLFDVQVEEDGPPTAVPSTPSSARGIASGESDDIFSALLEDSAPNSTSGAARNTRVTPQRQPDMSSSENKSGDSMARGLQILDYILQSTMWLYRHIFAFPSRAADAARGLAASGRRGLLAAHVVFGAFSACLFMFRGFSNRGGFRSIFVPILLLECAHFWTVKNVSGPKLIGLWWGFAPPSDVEPPRPPAGECELFLSGPYQFVSLGLHRNFHPSVPVAFWGTLAAHPTVWAVFFFAEFVGPAQFAWLFLSLVAALGGAANLLGFRRAHQEYISAFQDEDITINLPS